MRLMNDKTENKDNESIQDTMKLQANIPKAVLIRESGNKTSRNKSMTKITEYPYETEQEKFNTSTIENVATTNENMQGEVELELQQYIEALKGEVEFDIPKIRNGRRQSAFGYAKFPRDANFQPNSNDGINGVLTVNPTAHAKFMAKVKYLESHKK